MSVYLGRLVNEILSIYLALISVQEEEEEEEEEEEGGGGGGTV